jgi:hypothetical protein
MDQREKMMTDMAREHQRMMDAVKALIDNRDHEAEPSGILVTLEGVIAATLLVVMQGDHRNAAAMMHEGIVPGVEGRLAMAAQALQQRLEK